VAYGIDSHCAEHFNVLSYVCQVEIEAIAVSRLGNLYDKFGKALYIIDYKGKAKVYFNRSIQLASSLHPRNCMAERKLQQLKLLINVKTSTYLRIFNQACLFVYIRCQCVRYLFITYCGHLNLFSIILFNAYIYAAKAIFMFAYKMFRMNIVTFVALFTRQRDAPNATSEMRHC